MNDNSMPVLHCQKSWEDFEKNLYFPQTVIKIHLIKMNIYNFCCQKGEIFFPFKKKYSYVRKKQKFLTKFSRDFSSVYTLRFLEILLSVYFIILSDLYHTAWVIHLWLPWLL